MYKMWQHEVHEFHIKCLSETRGKGMAWKT